MQATTTSLDAAREEVLETDNVQPRELHFTELPIRVTPEPEINFKVHLDLDPSGEFPLELTPYSLKTLSAAIGIPSAFLPKLSAKLVDELLKHFIEQTSEKRRANLIIKGSEVLAFTSPRFLPAKTTPLWDAVESKVNQVQVGELRLHHYRHTGITTQVGLSAGSRYELATPAAGEPIGVKFGVFFRNSLVRSHHTEVMPYIARLDKQCSIVLPYTDDEPALRLRLDEPSPEDWMSPRPTLSFSVRSPSSCRPRNLSTLYSGMKSTYMRSKLLRQHFLDPFVTSS